jgi:hypothetical protein
VFSVTRSDKRPSGAQERWRALEGVAVTPHLGKLAADYLDREQKSREALSARLTAIVGFSGALLTIALATGRSAADADVSNTARTIVSVCFVATIVFLALSVIRCLIAIRPTEQPTANAELLRYYAERSVSEEEVRLDNFKLNGVSVEVLGVSNRDRARAVRDALALVAIALLFTAVGAITIYFASS